MGRLQSSNLHLREENIKGFFFSTRVETRQIFQIIKKSFFKYVNSKRMSNENIGLLLDEVSNLTSKDHKASDAQSNHSQTTD